MTRLVQVKWVLHAWLETLMQLGLQASGGHPETCENNAGPDGGPGS